MRATDFLRQQHAEIRSTFEALARADARHAPSIFRALAATLAAHDRVERQLFYPAYELAVGFEDAAEDAHIEHGAIEFSLHRADANMGMENFEAFCEIARSLVEHHFQREEADHFACVDAASAALAREGIDLFVLGAKIERRFERVLQEGLRIDLLKDLSLTLAGALQAMPIPAGQAVDDAIF